MDRPNIKALSKSAGKAIIGSVLPGFSNGDNPLKNNYYYNAAQTLKSKYEEINKSNSIKKDSKDTSSNDNKDSGDKQGGRRRESKLDKLNNQVGISNALLLGVLDNNIKQTILLNTINSNIKKGKGLGTGFGSGSGIIGSIKDTITGVVGAITGSAFIKSIRGAAGKPSRLPFNPATMFATAFASMNYAEGQGQKNINNTLLNKNNIDEWNKNHPKEQFGPPIPKKIAVKGNSPTDMLNNIRELSKRGQENKKSPEIEALLKKNDEKKNNLSASTIVVNANNIVLSGINFNPSNYGGKGTNGFTGSDNFSKFPTQTPNSEGGNTSVVKSGGSTPNSNANRNLTPNGETTPNVSGAGGALGGLISKGEGNYSSYNRGIAGDSRGKSIDFSQMTVGELMRRQALPKDDPNRIFAAGKYQVIPDTMKGAVKALNIDPNEKVTNELQEKIFRQYLISQKRPEVKDYITSKSNDIHKAQLGLAKEFASVADPNTGRSRYGGLGGNKASISSEQQVIALNKERANFQELIKSGKSPEEAWAELSSAKKKLNNNPNVSKNDLRIKGGLNGQATAGGDTQEGVFALASDIQRNHPELNRFTAFNDAYHHKGLGYHSKHQDGLATDFTVNNRKDAERISNSIRDELKDMGIDAQVLNEYKKRSIRGTGGHIHVGFKSNEDAEKYQTISQRNADLRQDLAQDQELEANAPNNNQGINLKQTSESDIDAKEAKPQASTPSIVHHNYNTPNDSGSSGTTGQKNDPGSVSAPDHLVHRYFTAY